MCTHIGDGIASYFHKYPVTCIDWLLSTGDISHLSSNNDTPQLEFDHGGEVVVDVRPNSKKKGILSPSVGNYHCYLVQLKSLMQAVKPRSSSTSQPLKMQSEATPRVRSHTSQDTLGKG